MPFTLVQAGTSLYSVNTDGFASPALTLPTGVTLVDNRVPRFTKFAQGLRSYIILVNTPTVPLSIDDTGVVRLLTPAAPSNALALSAGAASTLTGTYLGLYTYFIADGSGNIISESGYSPLMSSAVSITNQKLKADWAVSPQTVTGVRLYRTATGPGSVYYFWHEVDDNTTTTYQGNETDASLAIEAGASLGSAPDLTLIASWQGRLWGVTRTDVDHLVYTESGTMYAWNALNSIPIGKIGSDAAGITAIIPRRNYLGVTKQNQFLQISGTSNTNFQQIYLADEVGCVSQESVQVFRDTAFFLWRDGVYTWSDEGIKSITNGKVRSWFTDPTVFNHAMFWRAFSCIDPVLLRYKLFLASAGSTTIDRYIEYDIMTGAWYGPHLTTAFTFKSAFQAYGADQNYYPMIGSEEGIISMEQEKRRDWEDSIAMRVSTKTFYSDDAEADKYFGEVSVNGPIMETGTVDVTPAVGQWDATVDGPPFEWDLTSGRQRLGRIGVGKNATLTFENDELDQDVILYGYEITPVNKIGRR